MLTTTRRAISYPNPDRSDRADSAVHIGNVALAADSDVIYNQGTDAARIAAAHQTGGGRFWWTTDTLLVWYDDGTTWRNISAPSTSAAGLLAARPAANAVVAGYRFFATDQVSDYVSDGATWTRVSVPAGTVVDWFLPAATAPTGWVLYDGSNLPASTGIYADLFAHLGTLTKPDTQGRFTVAKGTNGDVSTIGVSDGLAVATRSPKHNMTNGVTATPSLTLPNHAHGPGTLDGTIRDPAIHDGNAGPAATAWSSSAPGSAQYQNPATVAIAGNTGNPTTTPAVAGTVAIAGTIGPGGTRPTDSGAFIVCSKMGKL